MLEKAICDCFYLCAIFVFIQNYVKLILRYNLGFGIVLYYVFFFSVWKVCSKLKIAYSVFLPITVARWLL
ncbi:hypothetical protein Psfp_02721 [Pelotomaculum sp. FP]|nr:hypothetical protein Psfp_02721 [Pelotomaculum sp. FP]